MRRFSNLHWCTFNFRVIKTVDYIIKLTRLLYPVKQVYNFSTGQIISDQIFERILCFYDGGKGNYIETDRNYIYRGIVKHQIRLKK